MTDTRMTMSAFLGCRYDRRNENGGGRGHTEGVDPIREEAAAMRWSEVDARQPKLAEAARRRLIDPGVVLVVTIRRDGTPRLSPVEPFLLDGDLWLSMMPGGEGEYKIRGTARAENSPDVHTAPPPPRSDRPNRIMTFSSAEWKQSPTGILGLATRNYRRR
jgi:hypothetical protein